ncbi:FtsX-like permease family protein [Kitasatospora sp. NPDC056446]|uniref:ABC transporter permease n=1 Tax=Kitasatospora sp. NPDC056446 TaxID=3345819 RepID=UPI0036CB7855
MLVIANVRERWTSFLASFMAVLVGVALISTTLVIYDSAKPTVLPRLEAATALVLPVQATDRNGSPKDRIPWSKAEADALIGKLRSVPGVGSVVIDRTFYAQAFRDGAPVRDDGAADAGHGFSSTGLAPYRLVSGRAPNTADEVAVDRALGVEAGRKLTVNLTAGRSDFTVVGTVDGPGFYFSDESAAQREPGVGVIALLAAPGAAAGELTAAARAAVGDQGSVVSGDGRSTIQPQYLDHKRFLGTQLIAAMATLGLFTTAFVVASMLVLATGLRRREIGLLRMIGASPAQVRRMVLGEAAAVGLLGSVAGCLAGIAAAPLLRDILLRLDVAPPDMAVRVAAWPLLTATAIGVGVSVIGAWAASRLAARVAPLEALLESRSGNRSMSRARLSSGLVVLGLGAVLAVMTATAAADNRVNMAIAATMVLIVAAALLAPVFVGPVGRAVTSPFGRSGSAGPMLIRAELTASSRRAASMAAPVIAAVGFAVLLSGMVETMRVAYPAGDALKLAGQAIVTNDGTPGNTDEVVAANPVGKAALPTRAFVHKADGSTVVIDALGSRDPNWGRPGEAVLGESVATWLGVKAGDQYPVRFADGTTVRLRIAEVLPDDPARGDFVMSRSLVRSHDPAALNDDVFVPEQVKPVAIPGTATHDAVEYALDSYNTDARLTDSLAAMLIAIAVGYSGIAVANSMAMAAHGRRRDFAVMKSAGGTIKQLLAFAVGETSLVVGIGAVLGVLVTLPPLSGMASGLSQVTKADVGLHLNLSTLAAVILGSLALAIAASAVVTWKTMRRAEI